MLNPIECSVEETYSKIKAVNLSSTLVSAKMNGKNAEGSEF